MKTWLQGLTLLLGAAVTAAQGEVINLPAGLMDQDALYSITTGNNTGRFFAPAEDLFLPVSADAGRTRSSLAPYLFEARTWGNSPADTIIQSLVDPNPFSLDIDQGALVAWSAYLDAGRGDEGTGINNVRFTRLPEPGTYALFGLGLLSLAYARRQMQ